MKNKKILSKITMLILLIGSLFILTGCDNVVNVAADTLTGLQETVNGNSDGTGSEPFSLTTTDDKLVFTGPTGSDYYVIYFENNIITKAQMVVDCGSEDKAKIAYAAYAISNLENEGEGEAGGSNVELNGQYIITSKSLADFIGSTKEEIQQELNLIGFILQ